MNTLDHLRHDAAWPLRRLGLEPGRALVNAQPGPAALKASKADQLAYIRTAQPPGAQQPPIPGVRA